MLVFIRHIGKLCLVSYVIPKIHLNYKVTSLDVDLFFFVFTFTQTPFIELKN